MTAAALKTAFNLTHEFTNLMQPRQIKSSFDTARVQRLLILLVWIWVLLPVSGCARASSKLIEVANMPGSASLPQSQESHVLTAAMGTTSTVEDGNDSKIYCDSCTAVKPRDLATWKQAPLAEDNQLNASKQSECPDCEFSFWRTLGCDQKNFYSGDSLGLLAVGFGAGAVIANTPIDDGLYRMFHQTESVSHRSEFHYTIDTLTEFGNGLYTIPVFVSAWTAGHYLEDKPHMATVGEWGERSTRAMLVGVGPLVALQRVTGGSRPGESDRGSHWSPFADENSVSGHSFMGTVPFLSAANMTENPWEKAAFYAGSAIVPISRITGNQHYPSQAILGWWTAWLAVKAVERTFSEEESWSISLLTEPYATGVSVEHRW